MGSVPNRALNHLQIPIYRAVLAFTPYAMHCVEYDHFITRIYFAPLPGALLSCFAKKVIKESTRGEALSFSSRLWVRFGTFLLGKGKALSSGLLTRRYRSRRFCFLVVICVASRLNFNSVPLGAHIHALRMQGASCRRRITTHDSGLHLAHRRWVHHSNQRFDKPEFEAWGSGVGRNCKIF